MSTIYAILQYVDCDLPKLTDLRAMIRQILMNRAGSSAI